MRLVLVMPAVECGIVEHPAYYLSGEIFFFQDIQMMQLVPCQVV
jgi:hypothetical protein